MAVDFTKMPFTDGLSNGFDGMTGVTADSWQNQIGDTDFILQNAEYADNTITLADSNIGYLPVAEPPEYTAYILCKTYIPSYVSNSWAQIFGCRNGTNRCYVGIYRGTDTSKIYKLRTYTTSTYYNPTMDNWHVITLKRTSGYFNVYADGELIISEANTATTRGDKFMIKSITDKGSTPTVDEAITVNIKCCVICDTAHTDLQVQNNADWLLIQYGFKNAPLDSKMSGADAAAIAWCIARNMEQSKSLEMQKKMYRKGLVSGGDEATEVITKPFDSEFDLIPDDTSDEASINMHKGVYLKTGEITIDGVTGVFQLHISLGDTIYNKLATGEYDWGIPPKVTLTGNGINKTLTFGNTSSMGATCWNGSTSSSAPGVSDGNEFWTTSAKIYKSTARFGGTYYWEYSGKYSTHYWELTGDFATALRAATVVSTVPFTDII